MINWYKNNLKYTCGIIITIKNGSFNEPQKYSGYTHIAEHMMFSGTKKIPLPSLKDKYLKIFNKIEATTSREEINIFTYFDLKDFETAIKILKQMILHWQCDPKNFLEEKKCLLQEANEYFHSHKYKMRNAIYKLLPLKNNEPLSSLTQLKKITFKDLKNVKKYWDGLLKESSPDLTIISNELKQEQIKLLNKIFCKNKNTTKNKKTKWEPSSVKLINNKKIAAFYFKSNNFNLNSLLLDRIFYWRWNNNLDYKFDYDFLQLKNTTAFYIYNETGLKEKQINDFFLKTINKKEFEAAKDLFLKSFRQTLDTVDIIESLKWFNGFVTKQYSNLPSNDPKKIYKQFEKLNYRDFNLFIKNLK